MLMRSHTRVLASTITLVFAISVIGCATLQDNPRTVRGAGIGAATGAGAGAAIGGIVGGKKGAGKGAAIGAVVGLLGGTAVGAYLDKQAREMDAILSEQDRLRREQERLTVVMASDVLFDVDSASVNPGARPKLRQLGDVMVRYPETTIQVVGHTDATGSDAYNQTLSVRRAEAVADELVAAGVAQRRISARGMGESMPVASNDSAAGRQQNRRVEIIVNPEQGAGGGATGY